MGKCIVQNKSEAIINYLVVIERKCTACRFVRCLPVRRIPKPCKRDRRLVISLSCAVCTSLRKNTQLVVKEPVAETDPRLVIVRAVGHRIVDTLREHIKMEVLGSFPQREIHNTANGIGIHVRSQRFRNLNSGEHV